MSATQTTAIDFTDAAAKKVWELMQDEGDLSLNLRVYITGGGCSGFQYGFTFDDATNDDDFIISKDAANDDHASAGSQVVNVVIDALSFQYLTGASIDYRQDLHGEQFVISNPNAKTTCGCGSSFSV